MIIKPKWKEYPNALAELETHLTVELLFPSSIFQKYFSWECSRSWVHADGRLQIVVWEGIGKCKHTAVWQWPLTLGPWDHTHGWGTVWVRWMFDVRFKGLKSPWIRVKDKVFGSPHFWLCFMSAVCTDDCGWDSFKVFMFSHCNSFSLSSGESVCCNKQFPA